MKKFTLTIDYSYLCYKSLFVTADPKRINESKFLDSEEDKCILTRKILKDIYTIIDKAIELISKENLESIVLACDSVTNFRKKILPESYKKDRKKHREENNTINFDEYFKIVNDISEVLRESSSIISVLKHYNFEADDLIYGMSSNENFNNLIYASDSDLEQTLSENVYMFKTYKDTKTLFVNENYAKIDDNKENKKDIIKEFDSFIEKDDNFFDSFFNNNEIKVFDENKTLNILEKSKLLNYKIEKVDVLELVLSKIISGDVSDNIQSIFYNLDESDIKKKCRKPFIKKIFKKYLEINENQKYFDIKLKPEVNLFFNFFVDHLFSEKYLESDINKIDAIREKLNNNFNINYDLIVFNNETYEKYCNEIPTKFIEDSNIKKFDNKLYVNEFENNDILKIILKVLEINEELIEKYCKKENIINIDFKIF